MKIFKTPSHPLPRGRHECMGPNTSENSTDLAMDDLCYEYSKDGVCLNIFDCALVDEEVTCTSKTETRQSAK